MQSAKLLSDRNSSEWEPSMGEVTTIGLDLAKHVFQVHGVDAEGTAVLRKQLRRAQVLAFFGRLPPCLIGLEACATAHYWGRELRALGHEVRLMPAQYDQGGDCRAAEIQRVAEIASRWPDMNT
jgi:transposase